ncbi:protein snakeskin [Anabrus simplex]|uniref:protein snakeskin n=1 Tax=Anabrus simplex TaxID=316456 RepID=UPI0035A3B7D2
MAISRLSFLKFIELALTITCIGLHIHSFSTGDDNHQLILSGTFVGFVVILVGQFLGIFTGQPVGRRADIFYSLAGCALFVACGALTIKYYDTWSTTFYKEQRNIGLAKGSVAIINGAAFLVDALLSFRYE